MAPQELPAALVFVWDLLFAQLIVEGDDFTQTLRKIAAVVNCVCGPFAAGYGAYWCYLSFTGEGGSGLGAGIQGVFTVLIMTVLFGNYFLVRRWKHVSDAHITIFMWILFFPCVGPVFGIPEFGTRILLMWYSILVVISQSNHVVAQCGLALIAQIMSCYNDAFKGHSDTLLLIPGARQNGPPWEVFIEKAGATFVSTTVIIGVFLQARDNTKQLAAARKTNAMAEVIVGLLNKYDCDAVNVAIDNFSVQGADPGLVKSFITMNTNLEKYKPFLPNYLFLTSDSDPDAPEGGDDEYSEGSIDIATVQSYNEKDRESTHGGYQTPKQALNGSAKQSFLRAPKSAYALKDLRTEESEISSETSSASGKVPRQVHGSGSGEGSRMRFTQQFDGKISYAWLDVSPNACRSASLSISSARLKASLIDNVYRIANSTKASVHSMVGDCIIVSWNATHRVVQPEAKAAQFVCRVKAAMEGHYLAAAVCSGSAKCESYTSATKQQAMLIHARWLPLLTAAFTLAKKYKTVILDEKTFDVGTFDVDAQPIDRVEWVEHDDPMIMDDDDPHVDPLNQSGLRRAPIRNSFPEYMCDLSARRPSHSLSGSPQPAPLSASLSMSGSNNHPNAIVPDDRSELADVNGSSLLKPRKDTSAFPSRQCTQLLCKGSAKVRGSPRGSNLLASPGSVTFSDSRDDLDRRPCEHRTRLYEAIAERNRADDEWMYQLAQDTSKKTHTSLVAAAFESALERRYQDAKAEIAKLEELIMKDAEKSTKAAPPFRLTPLVARLRAFIEQKLLEL